MVFSADIYDRSQWRGRGGFSPRFPILRNSAPEPFVYSIVIHILYHVGLFFANIFLKKNIWKRKTDVVFPPHSYASTEARQSSQNPISEAAKFR